MSPGPDWAAQRRRKALVCRNQKVTAGLTVQQVKGSVNGRTG
jgi:hypothetical protein